MSLKKRINGGSVFAERTISGAEAGGEAEIVFSYSPPPLPPPVLGVEISFKLSELSETIDLLERRQDATYKILKQLVKLIKSK